MKAHIIYVRPDKGGIADYGKQIEAIYAQQGITLEKVLVSRDSNPRQLLEELKSKDATIYHFEIGAANDTVFQLSRQLRRSTNAVIVSTLHDPGVLVWHPIRVSLVESKTHLISLIGKVWRKLIDLTVGQVVLNQYRADTRIKKVYLQKSLVTKPSSYYLPQPTYHSERPKVRITSKVPRTIGFAGFWGANKGLETLIEAWDKLDKKANPNLKLVVAGGTAVADEAYDKSMRAQLTKLTPKPDLPGFVADDQLDSFLQSLSVLTLPYWPELPSGTSAMGMRAAELGIPIIASDVPALRSLLGPDGAVYVEPKSSDSLRVAIEALANKWSGVQNQANQTQQRIFAEHSWPAVGKILTDIITKSSIS